MKPFVWIAVAMLAVSCTPTITMDLHRCMLEAARSSAYRQGVEDGKKSASKTQEQKRGQSCKQ